MPMDEKMNFKTAVVLMVSCLLLLATNGKAQERSAAHIIGPYHNVFTSPPIKTPGNVAVDAPLLGNGYCAAAIAGPPEQQNYFLARNDLWRLRSGYNESFPAVLGKLQINIPALKHATYRIEQDLYNAATSTDLNKGDTSVDIRSIITATRDWLVLKISNNGKAAVTGNILLTLPGAEQFHISPPLENKFADSIAYGNDKNGVQWIERGFVQDVTIKSMAAAAVKLLGSTSGTFSISPGQNIVVLCALSGNFKTPDCLQFVRQQTARATLQLINGALKEHQLWWHRYWNESMVDIPDSIIAHQYYRSQYNMASCSRDPKFPPGIFGSWVTQEMPAWNGDYHLNYNYIAPFYALYSSNHLQQALPFEAPVIDFIERGKYYAKKLTQIPDGVLYPVGIGPLGIETTKKNDLMVKYRSEYLKTGDAEDEGLFFGQKSNAAYCVTNLSMEFYRTYDVKFTKRVYPFVKAVAIFWQHYLKKENGHYSIENDAIHEGTIGTKNPILSLGLVPMVLKTAIDMSVLLKVDEALRTDWQDKHDHIADYSVQVKNGKTVFRYSEKGTDWWPDNTLGIQHIYPAGQIGLSSDSDLLQIARNTIAEMHRWKDFNGSNSFFPAAVRVGYNADTILARLKDYSLHTYANGFQLNNPHGIENCSTVPNTINEMLCMSNQNVLRVFEVWPKEKDASFTNIRSEGAFLVSAAIKDKVVQYIKIVSEKGRSCVVKNPWPGKMVIVKSNKKAALKISGILINLQTLSDEKLTITMSKQNSDQQY